MAKLRLALFDFDGTLTVCDSFIPFLLAVAGPKRFFLAVLKLFQLRLKGPIERGSAKAKMIGDAIGGWDEEIVLRLAKQFVEQDLLSALNPQMVRLFEEEKARGARVIIISASPELYLQFVAAHFNCELVGTRVKIEKSKIKGELIGDNCRAPEKVRRLAELVPNYSEMEISAFGDTAGDKEMLEIATEPNYRAARGPGYLALRISKIFTLYCRALAFKREPVA